MIGMSPAQAGNNPAPMLAGAHLVASPFLKAGRVQLQRVKRLLLERKAANHY
jgi:hypothetical protein